MINRKPSYVEIIGLRFPNVQVFCTGDVNSYDDVQFTDEVLDKATLDTLILQETKTRVWREIQAERDRRKNNGINVDTKWFHTDDASRIQHIGMVLLGQSLPTGIMWKTMDGTFIEMTPTLAQQIFNSVVANDQQVFACAEQKSIQMESSANPENYDIFSTPTWPLTFGE